MSQMKTVAISGAFVIILAIVIFGVIGTPENNNNNQVTGNVAQAAKVNSDGYQEVTLSFKNYEYQLTPSTFVKDVPVRMTVDLNTVYGCMRDVVIPTFGVRKYVSTGNNIIEFTPTKAGTFNIMCSMNMGRGTFTVVESDGSKSAFVEAPADTGGSCGSGADGCGCGGS
ncbi:MAG: cupredoxin domain-containing protein [archaeon]